MKRLGSFRKRAEKKGTPVDLESDQIGLDITAGSSFEPAPVVTRNYFRGSLHALQRPRDFGGGGL
jgi:hypothetical protein